MTGQAMTCSGENLQLARSLQEAGAAPDPALRGWPACEVAYSQCQAWKSLSMHDEDQD